MEKLPLAFIALLGFVVPAYAMSPEEVASKASNVNVLIAGATEGSGVIVERSGNNYTILTAWHVIKDNKAGEEILIQVPSGSKYFTDIGKAERLSDSDLAKITFVSKNTYPIASLGDSSTVKQGSTIYVAGFPLPSSVVPQRILRFVPGSVIATSNIRLPGGYQILYTNPTLPGMSGGSVLNSSGQLIGIHGRGETDIKATQQSNVFIKTGTNLAMPIDLYAKSNTTKIQITSIDKSTNSTDLRFDDYIVQAANLYQTFRLEQGTKDDAKIDARRTQEIVLLTSKAIDLKESAYAYRLRADALRTNPTYRFALLDLETMVAKMSDRKVFGSEYKKQLLNAVSDYTKALDLDPTNSDLYVGRAWTYSHMAAMNFLKDGYDLAEKDTKKSVELLKKSIELDPSSLSSYVTRIGIYKSQGDDLNVKRLIDDIDKLFPGKPESYLAKAEYYSTVKSENLSFQDSVDEKVKNELKALSYYEKAIQAGPEHFDSLFSFVNFNGGVARSAKSYNDFWKDSCREEDLILRREIWFWEICRNSKVSAILKKEWGIGDHYLTIKYAQRAISLNPERHSDISRLYGSLAFAKKEIGDSLGACIDYETSLKYDVTQSIDGHYGCR